MNPEGREYPLGDKGGGPLAVEDLNKIVNKKNKNMKTTILTLIMIVSFCFVAQAQYDTILTFDYNQTLVIPDLPYGSSYTIGKKNGGEFILKPNDYIPSSVGWSTPSCGAPMGDSLTTCGPGHYVVNYQKSGGTPWYEDIYIKYFVDITDSTSGSPTYGQYPDSISHQSGMPVYVSAGPNFVGGFWGEVGQSGTMWLNPNNVFTITTDGTYWFQCGDEDNYISYDTITVYIACIPDLITIDFTICDGEVYWAGGSWQSTSGTYVDTLSNINGCDSIVTTNLTVNPLTTLDLGPDSVTVQQSQTATLTATVSDVCTFIWSTGETTQSIIVDTSGWYYVTATSVCGDLIDSVFVDVITSVPSFYRSIVPTVQLCPNPSQNSINISGLTSDIKKIEIWSTGGKLVMSFLTNNTSIIIDVSMLPKSIYLVKIGSKTLKLSKL
ncbi:T9SS type A sorting domain-containing protein [Patescibacteria group bacterium]|nr:T9SS type A sorting domain-containing protein [Patescibacteria group bacterium]